jgi:hypothetical protein
MAGIVNAWTLDSAKSDKQARELVDMPVVSYARTFGQCNGRGDAEIAAYQELVQAYGEKEAEVHRAMCWFLLWGSHTGNTLNGFIGAKPSKPGASNFFLVTFFLYYALLFFGIINAVAFIIKFMPQVPPWFSSGFGAVLISVASVWKVPLGILAHIAGAKDEMPSSLTVSAGARKTK